jgi:epoxyqueuosine reductase
MHWLHNRFHHRTDPAAYLPAATSVICVALNYYVPLTQLPPIHRKHHGTIARYALGQDYHLIITKRLHILADWLRQVAPHAKTRVCVDTAPVMEKELASHAGLGWIGKNTCLINHHIGSWTVLGQIITTLNLPHDPPGIDRCGTCTRCIDACPTAAISAPYHLDARRCISYLTIEHRHDIPTQFHHNIAPWLFGCDICQQVCPWNHSPPAATDPELQPRFPTGTLNLQTLLAWTSQDYRQNLANSAIKRAKLPLLQRNARIIAQNPP